MIEEVQKFAARLATKQWNTSYNDLLAQLGWPLLSTRCKQQKLFLCHRILSGYSIIPPIQLHTSSFSYSPTLTPPTSLHTCHQIHCLLCLFSLSSVVLLWNNLPLDTVLATSHSAFKSKINPSKYCSLTVLLYTCICNCCLSMFLV